MQIYAVLALRLAAAGLLKVVFLAAAALTDNDLAGALATALDLTEATIFLIAA